MSSRRQRKAGSAARAPEFPSKALVLALFAAAALASGLTLLRPASAAGRQEAAPLSVAASAASLPDLVWMKGGHAGGHGKAALSPDGKLVAAAVGGGDPSVILFDAATGGVARTLGRFAANAVAFSRDGFVAAAGADQFGDPPAVPVWRASDGLLVAKLFGLSFITDAVAFSPDGRYLAAGDWGGSGATPKIMVWHAPAFAPVQTLGPYAGSGGQIAFTPDSQTIAGYGAGGAVTLWRLPDGVQTGAVPVNINGDEQYVASLLANAGLDPSRAGPIVAGLRAGALTGADALLSVADDAELRLKEKSRAFVLMQYYGYLRRDPDAEGYGYWLGKLNSFGGDFVRAEMVKAFLDSDEYRRRFGR
jgi:hypothetical protein